MGFRGMARLQFVRRVLRELDDVVGDRRALGCVLHDARWNKRMGVLREPHLGCRAKCGSDDEEGGFETPKVASRNSRGCSAGD